MAKNSNKGASMPKQNLHDISEQDFYLHIPDRARMGRSFKDYGIERAYWGDLGNYTVVVLRTKGGEVFAGVAKRNPVDNFSYDVGLDIAAVRAWRAVRNENPGYDRQHPVSKRAAKLASNINCLEAVFDAIAKETRC